MKKVLSVLITAALMLQLLVMFGAVSAAGSAAITVANASGTVGSTVTVEVGIANNPGFHALQCEIEYDETLLELVSIEGKIGRALTPDQMLGSDDLDHQFISSVEEANFVYFGVYSTGNEVAPLAGDKIIGDVTIATLTFKMLATGNADVTVNCIASVALDANYEEMEIIPTSSGIGSVTIAEKPAYVLGDADGNGVVNMFDAIAIRRYLVNKEQYPLNGGLEAADVDGKPSVTMFDAIAIRRYLVNKEQYPFVQN